MLLASESVSSPSQSRRTHRHSAAPVDLQRNPFPEQGTTFDQHNSKEHLCRRILVRNRTIDLSTQVCDVVSSKLMHGQHNHLQGSLICKTVESPRM